MNQEERQRRDIEIAKTTAVSHLKLVPRDQSLGTPLFEAIMRLSVGVAVEAVLLRENGGKLEVYLNKRAADDPAYPGQYHCPGSYMRPGESYADVFERLNEREFKTRITKGRLVGIHNNTNEERGHTQSHIFLVEVESEPQAKNGGWFSVNNLPEETVCHHVWPIIPTACEACHEYKIDFSLSES